MTTMGAAIEPWAVSASPLGPLAAKPRNGGIENRFDLETRSVAFEIGNHLFAREIGRIVGRHGHPGQTGMIAVGMQMKPVVMPPPGSADIAGFLEHRDIQPRR